VQLTSEQRRFLWLGQSPVGFGINVVLAGAIGWAMFRGTGTIPLWGESSIGGDTLGTSFFLPLISCMIVTPLVRSQVRKGATSAFTGALASWLRPFQVSVPARAVALGFVSLALGGGGAVALLSVLRVEAFGFAAFLGWKVLYAGVLGALVSPAIALLALADRPRR